jgi:penicillin G amidase
MTPWLRSVRRGAHALTAGAVSAVVLGVLALGFGPLPALGRALDPGQGVWTSASGGILPRSQTLSIPGLEHRVSIRFTAQGVPSIQAADDSDLYLAQGYVEASFRLTEMDLDRRLGEGALAQFVGRPGVASDEFELRLGLLRTAEEEWARTPRSSPSGQELLAYARGVNDYIAHERTAKDWPALISLTGVFPQEWTPVDSLVVQEVLTQELDFTGTPLDYALLERSLGAAKTMAWFPVDAANPQSPYDPGPYQYLGIKPIAVDAASTVDGVGSAGAGSTGAGDGESASSAIAAPSKVTSGLAEAVASVLASVSRLPAGQVHQYPDSNAWAANGPEVSGGGAMLAGDPHLPETLPSVWYQIALGSPDLAVSGVSLPGVPGIVIGRNVHIAWSLTDVQNQSTLFYAEDTSKSHPDQYYWRGRWRPMRQAHYTIDVRGAAPVHLTVDITVHGPIMTEAGQTLAVDWMGNVPSPDIAVMGEISKASNFAQFRAALAGWVAPTQNFVYADDAGNIGAIAAGYYPQVARGDPWLPLSGTGADDVAGVIPYAAVPQVYDPEGHTIASANQRPVGSSYPYYIGTSADFFDPGYRSTEIYTYLRGHSGMDMADFAALQLSDTDSQAGTITPRLVAALRGDPALDATERAALRLLSRWNDTMTASSAAATIWFTFWRDYVSAVFQPWWKAAKVPVAKDPAGLAANWQQFSLVEDLQAWTVADPGNPAFTPPGAATRTATQVMRSAFAAAVAQLSAKLGRAPDTWMWGRVHSIQFPSITGADALGYGPVPAGGDDWTVSAADGYPVSSQGPSWRMIVKFADRGQSSAAGIYPGGQSENPASPWYSDLIAYWQKGTYLAMPPAGGYSAGSITWSLRPGGES